MKDDLPAWPAGAQREVAVAREAAIGECKWRRGVGDDYGMFKSGLCQAVIEAGVMGRKEGAGTLARGLK